MTFVHVTVHHDTHTCPADPEPHPYDTRRTVIAVYDGGPCLRPVTVRSGDTTTTTIACGRHVPREQRCPACRVVVVEHAITTEFMGHGSQHPHPTSGVAA